MIYLDSLHFQPIILDNLVSSMKYVVTGMRLLDIEFQYATNKVLHQDKKEVFTTSLTYFTTVSYRTWPKNLYCATNTLTTTVFYFLIWSLSSRHCGRTMESGKQWLEALNMN